MKRLVAMASTPVLVVALTIWKGGYLVDLASVAHDDPYAECTLKYDSRKTDLRATGWDWSWPGWTCHFGTGPDGHVP